jgi:hypothetical protein
VIDVGRDFERMRDSILGRLSDEEQQAFDERLARDPALVAEFERSLRMTEGMRVLRAQGYFRTEPSRARRFRIWRPALAAAAVAGLGLFLWTQRTSAPPPLLMASPEPLAAAARASIVHFTFVAVRGDSAPGLGLPAAGMVEFRVAPQPRSSTARYRMTLVDHSHTFPKVLSAVSGLVPGTDGYVHSYTDASRLTPGSYVLRLEPDGGSATTPQTFSFNLHASAPDP